MSEIMRACTLLHHRWLVCEGINALVHVASPQMAHLWLGAKAVSDCTVFFMSRIINCSQEEAFGNLLSRLADQGSQVLRESGWSCDSFFFPFFVVSGCTVFFRSRIINCSQEEALAIYCQD